MAAIGPYPRPRIKKGRYYARIGYTITDSGRYALKEWSFGRDHDAALAACLLKHKAWETISKQAAQDNVAPVWPTTIRAITALEEPHAVASTKAATNPTIHRLREMYLAAKRELVGVHVIGIKPQSYNEIVNSLTYAMNKSPLDQETLLSNLTSKELEEYVDFWMTLPGGISRRTASNYCMRLKEMLNWAAAQADLDFALPAGANKLFKLGNAVAQRRERYDEKNKTILRAIFKHAAPNAKLFALLGLQCGYYGQDASDLQPCDLKQVDGEPCIWRMRSKEQSNAFQTLHWLFPETAALIEKCRSTWNDHGLLFTNRRGGPLQAEETNGTRRSAVDYAYRTALKKAAIDPSIRPEWTRNLKRGRVIVDLPFKQLRKIAWNYMDEHFGSTIARKFGGQKHEGISGAYRADYWADLTAALGKWREQLIANEVLVPVAEKKAAV